MYPPSISNSSFGATKLPAEAGHGALGHEVVGAVAGHEADRVPVHSPALPFPEVVVAGVHHKVELHVLLWSARRLLLLLWSGSVIASGARLEAAKYEILEILPGGGGGTVLVVKSSPLGVGGACEIVCRIENLVAVLVDGDCVKEALALKTG
ncbi:uncharacterized protein LOC112344488 [Selaginella moellendorffii]|uniref:uncharacterized protein LOC112344488 n=1 Tax=Selaginella moellendorffii TaxID=88036 RepID=UPI000D1C41B6|nr:uncharacterized protein LOC112344488 [Selaginella moellendorffii]|eukprot:XP_024525142.1 uncharacterized protein LOC112344488 [Selaginella moellendorffii]